MLKLGRMDKCIVCSHSLEGQFQLLETGTSLCEPLCDLLELSFLLKQKEFTKVQNCELCDDCAALIRNSLDVHKQIENLKVSLKQIGISLRELILSSAFSPQSSDHHEAFLRRKKLFAQCLSQCVVPVTKLSDEDITGIKKEVVGEINTTADENIEEQVLKAVIEEVIAMEEKMMVIEEEVSPKVEVPPTGRQKRKRKPAAILTSSDYLTPAYIKPEPAVKSDSEDHDDYVPESVRESEDDEPLTGAEEEVEADDSSGTEIKTPRKKRAPGKKRAPRKNRPQGFLSFTCNHCGQKWKASDHLKPDGTYEFVCELEQCPSTFSSLKAFRGHHSRFCTEKPNGLTPKKSRRDRNLPPLPPKQYISYICSYCQRIWYAQDHKSPDGTEVYECEQTECPGTFNTLKAFRGHHDRHCSSKLAGVLPMDQKTRLELRSHLKYDGRKRAQFTCKHCGKTWKRDDHKTPDGGYLFQCTFEKCPREFTDYKKFRSHHKTNCLDKPVQFFKCDTCDMIFKRQKGLVEHRDTIHLKAFKYCCDVCGYGAASQGRLHAHMLIHTKVKRFKCELCDQAFIYRYHLKRHLLRHNNEKPYVCATCGKAFVLQQGLKNHEALHTNIKKYPCNLCDRWFVSSLQKHCHIYHSHKKPERRRKMKLAAAEPVCPEVAAVVETSTTIEPSASPVN